MTKGKDQLPPTNAIVYYLIITIGGCSPFIITDKAGQEPYTSPRWHTFLNDASNEYGDVGGMSSLPAGGDQRTFY